MSEEFRNPKKVEYVNRLKKYLDEYKSIIIVSCDNVGSNHMQKIRQTLRGKAVLLMGKKTMVRKAVHDHCAQNPALEHLIPHIHGNIGFVFTNEDLTETRNALISLKVSAPAKAGTVAPNDVIVPAGPTGLEPTQTSFLQALNISSKINKGQVEILNPVTLIKEGERVGQSEATLLSKLNIKPFNYGLHAVVVYDNGLVYDNKVLDMTEEDVFSRIRRGAQDIAALSLAVSYPTIAAVPHLIINGFKDLLHFAVATEYSFPQADAVKELLANPEALAAAQAAAAAPAAAAEEKKEEVKEEKKEEEEEEEEGDFGLDLFG